MKLGFVGYTHGRVFHAIAALIMWQTRYGQKLDLIVQVGDFRAYPDCDELAKNNKFALEDPSEFDFCKYISAGRPLKESLLYAKGYLKSPIYFIRGNHEDSKWLTSLANGRTYPFCMDELNLVYYVPDGTIMNFCELNLAFLGGIEADTAEPRAISENMFSKLINAGAGKIDILITHDAPYGIGTNFKGKIQGSRKITELLEAVHPKFLIAGHYHHAVGPQVIGSTTYIGLNVLVPPLRKDESRCVQPGSIAILDTETGSLEFVNDAWLSELDKSFNFDDFIGRLRMSEASSTT